MAQNFKFIITIVTETQVENDGIIMWLLKRILVAPFLAEMRNYQYDKPGYPPAL